MHNPFHVKRTTIVMIAALLATALPLSSCGSNDPKPSAGETITGGFLELRMEAQKVITDSVRREKYLSATTALETGLNEFDQAANSIVREYQAAFRNYDVDKAALSGIAAKYRAEQSKAIADFVQAHTAMAASVTADEWKSLARKEAKLIGDIKAAAARSVE